MYHFDDDQVDDHADVRFVVATEHARAAVKRFY